LWSLLALGVLLAGTLAASAAPQPTPSENLAAARRQYRLARRMEGSLEKQLGGTRTPAEYLKVIQAYRRVALITPAAEVVTPALIEVARLYVQMGHLFRRVYFHKAVDAYQYLLREYPRTRFGPDALYSIAELERGPLENPALGRKFLESVIAKYPSSDQADQARLELLKSPSTQPAEGPRSEPAPRAAAGGPERGATLMPVTAPVSGGRRRHRYTRVRKIVSEQLGGQTVIVVSLDGPVKYESAFIPRPRRLFFNLSNAYLVHPHGTTLEPRTRYVGVVRIAQNEPNVVRVVLDVRRGAGYSASLLSHPYRLVIRVGKAGDAAKGGGQNSAADFPAPAMGNLTPARPLRGSARTSLTRALGLKIYRIVIDPGHGGFDTGAIGPNGLEEKTVCLNIAKRLGRLIRRRLPDTKVIYTRDTDVFVPLEERTRIANQDKADLFISIHANSSPDHAARGVTAYYLNFTSSPRALAVAARENALAQEPEHDLQNLLRKISLNDKIDESREFAADVDHAVVHEIRLDHIEIPNRGVKKAPFVVLIGAHMPSILVEVSFLSNPTDDHLLGEASYRQRIALGLFDGIRRYIASLNSLPDTAATSQAANDRR
jgi:N-acetylmuramoyl-L-alanine amidase